MHDKRIKIRTKRTKERLNQGVLKYQAFREPNFNAYAVRIFTSNAF